MKNLLTILVIALLFFTGMLGIAAIIDKISSFLLVKGGILVAAKVGMWLVASVSLGIGVFFLSYLIAMLIRSSLNVKNPS